MIRDVVQMRLDEAVWWLEDTMGYDVTQLFSPCSGFLHAILARVRINVLSNSSRSFISAGVMSSM